MGNTASKAAESIVDLAKNLPQKAQDDLMDALDQASIYMAKCAEGLEKFDPHARCLSLVRDAIKYARHIGAPTESTCALASLDMSGVNTALGALGEVMA